MTKRIAYLSIHFLITLFLLCGLQKWVFLIYNWNRGGSSCTAQKVRPGEFSEIVISQGDVIFFQQRTSGTEG